ncbi:MAG: phosphoenolpyruvate carboxykinase (GTP) [Candidatus Omnitrophica bacterium]|nr:phosphoenolpyruvate carboxykinase (GTP) [Candidatus Omnitrophota bacterium]
MVKHKMLNNWVKECVKLCKPDTIVWVDGSERMKKELEDQAVASGEFIRLNQKKLPGCLLHRTALDDVARTENLTFICTSTRKAAGPTNNWMPPDEAYAKASKILSGSMKGRAMYIIPFSMGPIGSEFSKIGIEITDSIYVVLNMYIMTRVGDKVLEQLGESGVFTKCLHGKADLDIKRRMILHIPQDNAIWSVGSGYGGNVLLGKKCLSLRIASYQAQKEGWLAEHMLIMGIEQPNGRIDYIAAAFPSACGKTNLAMLVPSDGMKKKGYKVWTVGDDIAWMRVDSDGRLWAINPEWGFFGVAPGTNRKTNPNAVETISKNTIFTNVLLRNDNTVWWEDGDDPEPKEGIDWRGFPWHPGMLDDEGNVLKGAHANSRFTAPAIQCPSISYRLEQHHGVPISAIIFGGRRAQVAPLVYESFDWQHGVYLGATMASERTAAQYGKQGEVRRDPMAMLPFCGYNMSKYFKHWLDMGKKMAKPPRIFHANWFRRDNKGNFIWPGYGENLRVLEWILNRCNGNAKAKKSPIGYLPYAKDLDISGLKLKDGAIKELFEINPLQWKQELESQKDFLDAFGRDLPKELLKEHAALKKRLDF